MADLSWFPLCSCHRPCTDRWVLNQTLFHSLTRYFLGGGEGAQAFKNAITTFCRCSDKIGCVKEEDEYRIWNLDVCSSEINICVCVCMCKKHCPSLLQNNSLWNGKCVCSFLCVCVCVSTRYPSGNQDPLHVSLSVSHTHVHPHILPFLSSLRTTYPPVKLAIAADSCITAVITCNWCWMGGVCPLSCHP